MTLRFRYSDGRTFVGGTYYENLVRAGGNCSNPLAWSTYYTHPSNYYDIGTYRVMDDVVGNAPVRHIGAKGFRFNAMSSTQVTIDQGLGSSWMAENSAPQCTGTQQYLPRYRRIEDTLTLGRQLCGFTFPVDSSTNRLLRPPLRCQSQIDRAQSLATTAVWNKRGRGSDTNMYESLAEVDKTLALLGQYLSSARKIAAAAKKNKPREFLREASAVYLMTRYGFSPTVNDIFHTLNALQTAVGVVIESSRVQETVSDFMSFAQSNDDAAAIKVNALVTQQIVAKTRVLSVDQYNRTLLDSLGFSVKNLVTVPYELLKMSFVYDWFANIGDFIGSLIPAFGLTQIGSCLVQVTEIEETYTGVSYDRSQLTVTPIQLPTQCACKRTWKLYDRFPGLRAPELHVKLDFKFDNVYRVADAASLFVQQMLHK